MTSLSASVCRLALPIALLVGVPGAGSAAGSSQSTAIYADLSGEVVLENERVLVQKFIVQPGQSTGVHRHPTDELLVFIKGGVLRSAAGRSTLWREGRVLWEGAAKSADEGSSNAGTTPIEIICVSLKPAPSASLVASPVHDPRDLYLNYPNIPGEDLLENDSVIVQRFVVNPGQWEGVHAHRPNMLYIHIKGGQWAARSKTEPEHAYPAPSPDGKVGWMPTIALSEGHESGNIGNNPIDLIWVTLKK
jgi:predicted metal-dependent enzyme (double-stranded beta helix superfamily)